MSMINDAENNLKTWNNLIVDYKIDDAINLCHTNINKYKKNYKYLSNESNNNDLFRTVLILAVIFKGLEEFSYLLKFLNTDNWHKNTNDVEYYWYQLCDSKDRLKYTKYYCQSPIVDSIIKEINDIENHFDEVFGKSFYSSPEIIVDKFVCSICGFDVRGCSHIEGDIYDSKICRYKAVNPLIKAVALVEKPRDPRCRVWSWNAKGNNTIEMMILAAFTVDDFLNE